MPPGGRAVGWGSQRGARTLHSVSRYRWAFSPRWILSHVFVATCVGVFVYAGLWQLSRLEGRRDANAVIEARAGAPAVPVQDVLAPDASAQRVEDSTFRQVTVRGTYRAADQVLIRNRTNHGAPGYWVITPLQLPDGDAVAVNRGWIPLATGDAGTDGYQPPSGDVEVVGRVRATQRQEGIGITDPPDGRLSTLSRVDVERLQKQMEPRLYPVSVELTSQQPAQANGLPDPVPAPELDDGSHLNYMGQWFIFAVLTIIVYPLLLRRVARNKQAEAASGGSNAETGAGPTDAGGDASERATSSVSEPVG